MLTAMLGPEELTGLPAAAFFASDSSDRVATAWSIASRGLDGNRGGQAPAAWATGNR